MAKHYSEFDDDVTPVEDMGLMQPSSDMKMFGGIVPKFDDNYEPIKLDETQLDLKKKSQDIVSNICNIYYKLDGEDMDPAIRDYLEGLKKVEEMNLQNLLLQVKASEHLLYSLLGRLNATGSVDNALYKLITETQEKSIALTLQVSQYVRSLPSYFKQLRFELSTNVDMVKVEQTQEMLELKQDTEDDDDNFVKRPQKGMRAFLKQLEEAEEEMKKEKETVEENTELPEQPKILNTKDEEDELRKQLLEENQ